MTDDTYLILVKGCGFTQPLVYLAQEEPEPAELIVTNSRPGNTSTQSENSD